MSRISHKHKFIFFAFPKTGSESVRQMLDPYSDIKAVHKSKITKDNPFYTHITPEETKKIFIKKGWNFDDYFKFACIRNPYSRLLSLYNMTFKNSAPPHFSDWILTLHPHSKERGNWFLNGQLAFIDYISEKNASGDRIILVDDVIKLEEINDQLPKLLLKLNILNKVVPHINKGNYLNFEKNKNIHGIDQINDNNVRNNKLVLKTNKNIAKNNNKLISKNISNHTDKPILKKNNIHISNYYNEKSEKFVSRQYIWELKEYNYFLK